MLYPNDHPRPGTFCCRSRLVLIACSQERREAWSARNLHRTDSKKMNSLSTPVLGSIFVLACGASIFSSNRAIISIESLAKGLGFSDWTLGILAALFADSPEIASSITAQAHAQSNISLGIVIGSNLFNVAALLGLGCLVARRVSFARVTLVFEGTVALVLSGLAILLADHLLSPNLVLAAASTVFLLYLISGTKPFITWLDTRSAKTPGRLLDMFSAQQHHEVHEALDNLPRVRQSTVTVAWSIVAVVGASYLMEVSASRLGTRYSIPSYFIGAVVLAAITSLPNLVAALYLANRSRSSALLSEAMNSNSINLFAGLFLPGVIFGLGTVSESSHLLTIACLALVLSTLVVAYVQRGLRATGGLAIIGAYLTVMVLIGLISS